MIKNGYSNFFLLLRIKNKILNNYYVLKKRSKMNAFFIFLSV